jgi:UDP-galactopyranose mutase
LYDFVVAGAGLAGSVLAERIASQLDQRVLVIEKRSHVGGCAYDSYDEHGVLLHRYGPHVFHTNDPRVVDYLSRFTAWRPYEHRALADLGGMRVPIPVNRDTINQLYGMRLETSRETELFYQLVRVPIPRPRNAEEAVLARVGRDLYEKLFHGYTRKQWGIEPRELRPSVTLRIPVRTNRDDRYFTDAFQLVPRDGYHRMFARMLDHPNIEVLLNTDFHDVAGALRYRHLVYTGPVDRFFEYRYGQLPYRGLRLVFEHHEVEHLLPVGQVNYPAEQAFTRVTESKHMTGQRCSGTTVTYEFPIAREHHGDEPFYPIPTDASLALFARYRRDAMRTPGVTFCGRLAEYRYRNMDQVVARALTLFARRIAGSGAAPLNVAGERG